MNGLIQKINQVVESEDYRLHRIGFVYFSSIIIFASTYYFTYLSDSRNFVFNQDVISSQIDRLLPSRTRQLDTDRQELSIVKELYESLAMNGLRSRVAFIPRTASGSDCFDIRDQSRYFRLCGSNNQLRWLSPDIMPLSLLCKGCAIEKPKGIFGPRIAVPANYNGLPALVNTWQREVSSRIIMQERHFRKLSGYSKDTTEVWGWFDFLYFSLTVQLGGSFGDILPNSRMIRVATSMQLVVTTYIVVVLLGISRDKNP
jgi:hypothetical protein